MESDQTREGSIPVGTSTVMVPKPAFAMRAHELPGDGAHDGQPFAGLKAGHGSKRT
jgi:hypothetical protein